MCIRGCCKGQGRSTGSLCVSNCRGGVGMLPERDGWGEMASGGPHTVALAPHSCRRCCHARPACTAVCRNSVSFQVGASPSLLAMCNQCRAQTTQPVSLLFISRLCLPVPFAALILMKREAGQEDPTPSQNQDHFPCRQREHLASTSLPLSLLLSFSVCYIFSFNEGNTCFPASFESLSILP